MREHYHRNAFKPFWNGEKNGVKRQVWTGLNITGDVFAFATPFDTNYTCESYKFHDISP